MYSHIKRSWPDASAQTPDGGCLANIAATITEFDDRAPGEKSMQVSSTLGIKTNGKHSRSVDGQASERAEQIRQLNLVLVASGLPAVSVDGRADDAFLN